jgi:hypothetical protein
MRKVSFVIRLSIQNHSAPPLTRESHGGNNERRRMIRGYDSS